MWGIIRKKGSWKQATEGLMLFHCDYAETTIIIIIITSMSSEGRRHKHVYVIIYIVNEIALALLI